MWDIQEGGNTSYTSTSLRLVHSFSSREDADEDEEEEKDGVEGASLLWRTGPFRCGGDTKAASSLPLFMAMADRGVSASKKRGEAVVEAEGGRVCE